jgi:hypothetical protein
MQLTLEIPDELAAALRATHGDDLSRAVLEQLALDGYHSGQLSRFQIQEMLGFTNRYEAEAWLGAKGANLNYSLEDLEADRETLDRILSD